LHAAIHIFQEQSQWTEQEVAADWGRYFNVYSFSGTYFNMATVGTGETDPAQVRGHHF